MPLHRCCFKSFKFPLWIKHNVQKQIKSEHDSFSWMLFMSTPTLVLCMWEQSDQLIFNGNVISRWMLTPNCDHDVLKCNHHHAVQHQTVNKRSFRHHRRVLFVVRDSFYNPWGVRYYRNMITETATSHGKAALKEESFDLLLKTFWYILGGLLVPLMNWVEQS